MTGSGWIIAGACTVAAGICITAFCEAVLWYLRRAEASKKRGGDTDEVSELPL